MLTDGCETMGHEAGEAAALKALSITDPHIILGLLAGGAVIFWFSGASMQAVTTGAYRAVEFIKKNIKLDSGTTEGERRRLQEGRRDLHPVCSERHVSTSSSPSSSSTLAFAFFDPNFFVGYLISIAVFGLFQAIFMANAGGAWDNAKKLVEVELQEKGTPLHAATVVGDTVGDPFKDTSSVALNPIIKFTTLFGLLAVELGNRTHEAGHGRRQDGLRGHLPRHRPLLRLALLLRHAHQVRQLIHRRDSQQTTGRSDFSDRPLNFPPPPCITSSAPSGAFPSSPSKRCRFSPGGGS